MVSDLVEFVSGPARLNRALNVIEGTVLITSRSANGGKGGRRYSDTALRQIAAMAEGLPAFLNHVSPEMAFKPRDVKDLVGVHRNVRYFPHEGRVVSNLHVAEHQASLVFGLADTLGGVIGNSLVSRGRVRREGDLEVVDEIQQLRSADLVSDPAATKGLFESRETALKDLVETDAAERLRCAITGAAYFPPAERARLDRFTEAIRRGEPLSEALAEDRTLLSETLPARLVAAVRGEPYVALPPGIHARMARAFDR